MWATLFATAALVAVLAGCGVNSDVDREIGARCDDSGDCDDRCLADPVDYPGGFCSVFCENDGDCSSSTSCVALEGGACLFGCATSVDCEFLGQGWLCVPADAIGGGQVMICRGS
jgi:hypothetical protein